MLQETWLSSSNRYRLKTLNPNFDASGIPGFDSGSRLLNGRPSKGLGFLWNNKYTKHVKFVNYDCDRIIGLELQGNTHKCLILNVYLPYECDENYKDFIHCLGKIISIVQTADTNHVIICGDFNSCFRKQFGKELLDFAEEHNLCISDKLLLPEFPEPYTYVS